MVTVEEDRPFVFDTIVGSGSIVMSLEKDGRVTITAKEIDMHTLTRLAALIDALRASEKKPAPSF